ncbi:hypothetical protein [Burkholderia pseudomallei]|uniref:hypothetical protein n=2 Tax=Burkholderia pseudomallei TaxID=28450 RepID=UPI000C77A608|nr:hypothetical protein [Burkholderia pseudomallei]AUL54967.1 hypothetical protein BHT10_02875 [Burkholderia pseudomallei]CAJ5998581.1 Uncharacterised protein [Burkholderia pseudomallei]CAJ6618024.1 Uncharacterised protein [Burkholderia pseudomallei]CAJ9913938.1 Uncharacterised protein [Burkholderia pseudomallei]CAJ9939691.1 Uncharacterised protein [Burkholderia pseudomallei]
MDEREMFEAWRKSLMAHPNLMKDADGYYEDYDTQIAWSSWQAARRTTPDREAITKLAEINGQLREQIERYQAVCAAAYQLVGVVDGPLRFLDALSNAANGEPMSTEDALNLLPVTLDECDSFRTAPTSDKGGAARNGRTDTSRSAPASEEEQK